MKDTKSVKPVSIQVSLTERDRRGTDEADALQTVSLSELRNKCLTENISCEELASHINSMVSKVMAKRNRQVDA